MSRFKIRAWDNVANELLYAGEDIDLIFQLGSEGIECTDIRNMTSAGDFVEGMEHLEYQQCIGRKDRQGRLVYEGDIIETTYNGQKSRYEVIYHNCSFWFISESGTRYRADQIYWGSLEVVDHIYSSGTKRSRKVEDDDIDKFRHHEEFPY